MIFMLSCPFSQAIRRACRLESIDTADNLFDEATPFALRNRRNVRVSPSSLDETSEEGIRTLGVLVKEDNVARLSMMSVTHADGADMAFAASCRLLRAP